MNYRKFEDLEVWKKSKKFVMLVYEKFAHCRDFDFRDQIRRASISIMNNIAEGFERDGNKELEDFFLWQRVLAEKYVRCFIWQEIFLIFLKLSFKRPLLIPRRFRKCLWDL